MDKNEIGKESLAYGYRAWILPVVLIVCIAVVGFWEVMANRSRSPFRPFNLTNEDLRGFSPVADGWAFLSVPVASSPIEPNIIALRVDHVSSSHASSPIHSIVPVLVRLVHGYNMCDCMKLKGYKVELIEERSQKSEVRSQESEIRNQKSAILLRQGYGGQVGNRKSENYCQVWRVTSGSGDVAIWVTSMLKAGDFSVVDMDVRSMPFPRIVMPDDPGWAPRGLTFASLKHPVENFSLFLRAKWNNARCDPATFLRLKTPAWASNELLTLVSGSQGQSVNPDQENVVIQNVLSAHCLLLHNLQTWNAEKDIKR